MYFILRCLLLLDSGSAGCSGKSTGSRPIGEAPVSDVTPRISQSCQDRANIVRCHGWCVFVAGFGQSRDEAQTRLYSKSFGLNTNSTCRCNIFDSRVAEASERPSDHQALKFPFGLHFHDNGYLNTWFILA